MEILDHQDRGPKSTAEEVEEGVEHLIAIFAPQGSLERALVQGHVPHRAQWTSSEEIVATAPQDVGIVPVTLNELPGGRGLPDPGLPVDQNRVTGVLAGSGMESLHAFEDVITLE
jgi:hypothetical protein